MPISTPQDLWIPGFKIDICISGSQDSWIWILGFKTDICISGHQDSWICNVHSRILNYCRYQDTKIH